MIEYCILHNIFFLVHLNLVLLFANFRITNLVQNVSLSEFSVVVEPEGDTDYSECRSERLNTSELAYGEVSEWENVTTGRYVYVAFPNLPKSFILLTLVWLHDDHCNY